MLKEAVSGNSEDGVKLKEKPVCYLYGNIL